MSRFTIKFLVRYLWIRAGSSHKKVKIVSWTFTICVYYRICELSCISTVYFLWVLQIILKTQHRSSDCPFVYESTMRWAISMPALYLLCVPTVKTFYMSLLLSLYKKRQCKRVFARCESLIFTYAYIFYMFVVHTSMYHLLMFLISLWFSLLFV